MGNDILTTRQRLLNHQDLKVGPIVYWMNRDQRIDDNYALITALSFAKKFNRDVHTLFVLAPSFLNLNCDLDTPIYRFMGRGLKYLTKRAEELNLNLTILRGEPIHVVTSFIKNIKAGLLITDFSPLKPLRLWREEIASSINIQMIEVDTHNIVPVWISSSKQEWGAYTLRPKLTKLLDQYLEPFSRLDQQKSGVITIDKSVKEWFERLGEDHNPICAMHQFIDKRLTDYHFRNNPNLDVTSRLSGYLHFGQLSAQRLALEVINSGHPSEEFIEELVIRRELAENYCFYNRDYDSSAGFPDWAKRTLMAHASDQREYVYSLEQFELAQTHDPVWNAAQTQLVKTNYMHGYMRMYWAKKILEWTHNVDEAFKIAIHLNDKYQLDGRDPSGYTGIAWALGGVHDRPWGERPIFGMIRYMNMAGLKRKFGIDEYIATWLDESRLF